MDSKRSMARITKSLLLLMACLIVLMAFECPDPHIKIKFQHGSKRVKYLTLKVLDHKLQLRLTGISYFGGIDDYDVGLSVQVDMKSVDSDDNLIIFPESVKAWFMATEMPLNKTKYTHLTDGKDGKEVSHLYEYQWHFDPKGNLITLFQNNKLDSNFLKFYLGNMLWYDGKRLPIDTVYATDPKAKRLKSEVNQYLKR